MFKHLTLFCVLLVTLFLGPRVADAYEQVRSLHSDITVSSDGTFSVVETIEYDFSGLERRGIFRDLKTTHPQKASAWYKDRRVSYDIESVTRNGVVEPFVETAAGDSVQVRIGNPDVTITGVHTYVLTYDVRGGYSYYDNETPEIYWNVTGHGWEVPITKATAQIIDPAGIATGQKACYRGYVGEATSCLSYATSTGVMYTTETLYPGEGFTIALGLQSTVATLVEESTKGFLLVWGLMVLVVLLVGRFAYRFQTAHKLELPVVAQYEPYPDLLPMFTGVVADGGLHGRDITAGILYLAQQGFIKIKHLEEKVLYFFEVDDYEVTLLKDPSDVPTVFHKEILSLLFTEGQAGDAVKLSSLKSDSKKQTHNRVVLMKLHKAVADDVVTRGFYETPVSTTTVVLLIAAVIPFGVLFGSGITIYISSLFGMQPTAYVFPVLIVTIFVPIVLAATMYRRRTKLGYAALNHIDGFKEFLSVTEKDRLKFHNAPQKSPEQFMEYLPYAVALGVEKEWAKAFKDIAINNPDWYDAGSSNQAFSATALTTNLSGFSSSFSASSGSGSSGGGSAGGGAGGGGGGSW